MKKFIVLMTVWSVALLVMVTGNAKSEIEYEIRYDTHTASTYPIKKKVEEIYRELVSGVHEESYILLVLHNKEMFAYKKDMQVEWKDNILYIIEGNGKGDKIKGTLSANSVCVPEVQPRSFLAEFFQ